jgi:thiol:disulfide interchange protein
MTFVITLVSISIHHGFTSGFFQKWLTMWGMAFGMAFPLVLIIMPPIKKFVARLVKDK